MNCQNVTVEDVIQFFDEGIDGMGKKDGVPRNQGVPDSLRLAQSWQLCELTEDEFKRLEIPDRTHTLIKDKDCQSLDLVVKTNVASRVKDLESGKDLAPLIVRTRLSTDNESSSFYIEDGAKRAISLKCYFENHPYKPVKAYVGQR